MTEKVKPLIVPKREKRAKPPTQEELDKAVEEFLQKGGSIDKGPETWTNFQNAEKFIEKYE